MAYIGRLGTLIETLTDINETVYQTELIAQMRVRYAAENILEYFNKAGLTDQLVEFINAESAVLNYDDANHHDLIENFWSKCVLNEKLSLQKYDEILESILPVYSEFDVVGVPSEKMGLLIEKKIISMTGDTLIFMRESC